MNDIPLAFVIQSNWNSVTLKYFCFTFVVALKRILQHLEICTRDCTGAWQFIYLRHSILLSQYYKYLSKGIFYLNFQKFMFNWQAAIGCFRNSPLKICLSSFLLRNCLPHVFHNIIYLIFSWISLKILIYFVLFLCFVFVEFFE